MSLAGTLALALAMVPLIASDLAEGAALDRVAERLGDEAVLTLAAFDAAAGESVHGPYSRFGWSHPGAMLVHQLALGLRVSGGRSELLPWWLAAWSIAWLVLAVALIARERSPWLRAGWLLASILAFASLRVSGGPSLLTILWNPLATLAPFFLLYALAWRRRSGLWAAPLVVLLHAYLVQSHVGYLAIATLVAGVALATVLRGAWARPRRQLVIAAVATGVTAVAAWWSASAANLIAIGAFFREGGHEAPAPAAALLLAAQRTQGPLLTLLGDLGSDELGLGLLCLQVLLLVAHTIERLTRRSGVPLSVCVLSLGGLAIAVVSAFGVDREIHPHQSHWLEIVGPMAWIGALWPLAWRRLRPYGWALAVAVALFVGVGSTSAATARMDARGIPAGRHAGRPDRLADLLEPFLAEGPVQLRFREADHDAWGMVAAVAVRSADRGHRVQLEPRFRFMFGRSRTRCGPECRPIWLSMGPPPGWRVLGSIPGFALVEPGDDESPPDGGALSVLEAWGTEGAPGWVVDGVALEGAPWNAPGCLRFRLGTSGIVLGVRGSPTALSVAADNNDAYEIACDRGAGFQRVGRVPPVAGWGIVSRRVEVPDLASCARIRLTPGTGDGSSSIAEVTAL
ncbi:MAG: hypothetical protein H6719_18230 [Sandaracinaceae bacterium]|nr:hypothetical protein [Sandaracinaceae bacterium]